MLKQASFKENEFTSNFEKSTPEVAAALI